MERERLDSQSSRRRGVAARALALLALYGVAQAGVIRHLLFTQHELCAEHHTVHHPRPAEVPDGSGTPLAPEDHGDCLPLAWRGTAAEPEVAWASRPLPSPLPDAPRGPPLLEPASSVQLLHVAPKLSPPLS